MNFKDQWATDENGNRFIFTVEMQKKLQAAGLPIEPASLPQIEGMNTAVSIPTFTATKQASARTEPRERESEGIDFDEPTSIQIDPMTGKYIGRMKWYNAKKGYGFLVRGGGEEIFFHKSGTVGEPTEIKEGAWVLYDVEETRKGPEATEIEPYDYDQGDAASDSD